MTLTSILPFKHDQAPGRASDDSYPTTLEFQVKKIACSSDGRSTNAYSVSTTGTFSTTSTTSTTSTASTASTTGTTSTVSTTASSGRTLGNDSSVLLSFVWSNLCSVVQISFHSCSDLGELVFPRLGCFVKGNMHLKIIRKFFLWYSWFYFKYLFFFSLDGMSDSIFFICTSIEAFIATKGV